MMAQLSYRKSFFLSMLLHGFAILMLLSTSSNQSPALVAEAKSLNNQSPAAPIAKQEDLIKAVSVSSQEVKEAMNRIKENRNRIRQVEDKRQEQLNQKALIAQKKRVKEQKRFEALQKETAKLEQKKKRQLAAEQSQLKKLQQQQIAEKKRIAELKRKQIEMKKKQELEAIKLAQDKKKKTEQLLQRRRLEQAKAERNRRQAIEEAVHDAENNERMAGEVDKFKALIINAISRQWIVPINADKQLSSQFKIRLAPNGVVLDVNLVRSSGDTILDRSAQSAIYKASPLPVPNDPKIFKVFREISLTVRPEIARG